MIHFVILAGPKGQSMMEDILLAEIEIRMEDWGEDGLLIASSMEDDPERGFFFLDFIDGLEINGPRDGFFPIGGMIRISEDGFAFFFF